MPGASAARDDAGVTLIEMVVSLFLVTLVLTGFTALAIAGAGSTLAADMGSRAAEVGNAQVEQLKSTTWTTLGLYDSDTTLAGASAATTCPGSGSVVSLGSTAPSPRAAPALQFTSIRDGHSYVVTSCITWYDDPADGIQAAGTETDSDLGNDVKRLKVTVQWTLLGKVHSQTFEALRSPTATEVPTVTHTTATLTLTAATPSPSSQSLAADYSLATPMTLTVTASFPATAVTVTYTGRAGSLTKSLATSDGGTTWTLTMAAGAAGGTFNAGSNTFTFNGTSASGSAQASARATFTAPPTPFTVTASAAPSSVTLSSTGYLSSDVTLRATTSIAATSVTVTFPVTGGTATKSLVSSDNLVWAGTLAANISPGPYNATSAEVFTFAASAPSGGTSATATITLQAAAAQNVVINSIAESAYKSTTLPYGRLCVKSAQSQPFADQTILITASNVAVTDTASIAWTADNGSSTLYFFGATQSSGVVTFQLTVPRSAVFTSTSTTVTATVKRTSTDQVSASSSQVIPVLRTNGNADRCM